MYLFLWTTLTGDVFLSTSMGVIVDRLWSIEERGEGIDEEEEEEDDNEGEDKSPDILELSSTSGLLIAGPTTIFGDFPSWLPWPWVIPVRMYSTLSSSSSPADWLGDCITLSVDAFLLPVGKGACLGVNRYNNDFRVKSIWFFYYYITLILIYLYDMTTLW